MSFVLPILPPELRIPLREEGEPVVAFVRPMVHEDLAMMLELHPTNDRGELPNTAMPWLVRRQLVRVEGLTLQGADGTPVPFDATNRLHVDALPWTWVAKLFAELQTRANISEQTAGNSAGPSDSVATTGGAA